MTTLIEKIKSIKEALKAVDPDIQLTVDAHADGVTATMFGPFPSFIFLLSEVEEDRFMIHVNADAANMVLYMGQVMRRRPMIHDGAFALNSVDSSLVMGADAYSKKEENILMFARDILEARRKAKQEQIIVPEQKIYLGD